MNIQSFGSLTLCLAGSKANIEPISYEKKRKRSKYELAFYILDLELYEISPKSESELGVMDGTYYYLPRE